MFYKEKEMEINRNNYETFFLLYLDRELNSADMQEVESFLGENADLQKEFALLQQAVFVPSELVFEQKESLYRREEKKRVIPFYWMRMAAAVALLIVGCWLIIARSTKLNELGNEQAQHVLPHQKLPLAEVKKEEMGNKETLQGSELNSKQPGKDAAHFQKNIFKNSGTGDVKVKSPLTEKNNQQQTPAITDVQNSSVSEEEVEPLLAVRKPATSELQSAENPGDIKTKQVAAVSGTEAAALVLASPKTADQIQYEGTVLKENEYPSDNAISVVSLNNNKGISGFFKKITKRNPADDNTRKLRVSVFQISY
jgi:hypothetical protein